MESDGEHDYDSSQDEDEDNDEYSDDVYSSGSDDDGLRGRHDRNSWFFHDAGPPSDADGRALVDAGITLQLQCEMGNRHVQRRCQYVEIPLYRLKDRPVPSDEDLRRMECAMCAHCEALAADFGPLPVLPGARPLPTAAPPSSPSGSTSPAYILKSSLL